MKLLAITIALLAVAVVGAAFVISRPHNHAKPCHRGIYGSSCGGALYGQ